MQDGGPKRNKPLERFRHSDLPAGQPALRSKDKNDGLKPYLYLRTKPTNIPKISNVPCGWITG